MGKGRKGNTLPHEKMTPTKWRHEDDKENVSEGGIGTITPALRRARCGVSGGSGSWRADSAARCGESLTYTCLASGWTEGQGVWNRGYAGVLEQTRDVEASLPFRLLGMDFDNGGEWLKLNWHLMRADGAGGCGGMTVRKRRISG